MKTVPLFRLILIAAAAMGVALVPALAWDEDEFPGDYVGSVSLPQGLTKDDVRDTIAKALIRREWQVKVKEDTHVVGYLNHRRREVTLTLAFDPEAIRLYSDGWALDRRGNRAKATTADGWVSNIKRDLEALFDQVSRR